MGENIVKLKDIVEVLNGYAFKSSKYISSGHRVMRITNVQKGILVDDDPKYYEHSNDLDRYELKVGDILISLTGNVGRVGMVNEAILPAYLNQRVGCLRIKSDKVYNEYLFHWLNNDSFEDNCIRNSNGIAQLNMSTEWLKDVEINLPSIEEQKRIAQVLDKADEIRQKKKLANDKFDEFLKSTFITMFGDPIKNEKNWNTESLSSVAQIKSYSGDVEENNGKYWLLNLDVVESNTGKILEYKYDSNIPSSTCCFNGDMVLYSKLRPYLNKVVLPNRTGYATSELVPLNPVKNKLNKYFLANLLRSKSFVDDINVRVAGAKMPRASMDYLRNFPVILPPIDQQNKFADIVEHVEIRKKNNEQVIEQMNNLFNSLSQRAFKGEL